MKKKTALIILYILTAYVILMIVISLYNKKYDSAIRGAVSLGFATWSFIMVINNLPNKSFGAYEKAYRDFLKDSFSDRIKRNELFKGIMLLNHSNYDKAIKAFNLLLAKCADNNDMAVVHFFIAVSSSASGNKKEAIKHYKESSMLNPTFIYSYLKLSDIYKEDAKYTEAIELLKKAIEVDRENHESYLLLSVLYYELMDYKEAITYATYATQLKSRLYKATQVLALSYAAIGDTKNAEKYYKMSISYGCQNPKGLRNMIDALYTTTKTQSYLHEIYEDIFEKTKRNCISFKQEQREVTYGSSKFGGTPHVPVGFKWPTYNGAPLNFFMQINLEDVKPYDTENLLPDKGMLYFFYDYTNQPWDSEEGSNFVSYFDVEIDLLVEATCPFGIIAFDEYALVFNNGYDVPSYEELSSQYDDIDYYSYDDFARQKGYNVNMIESNKILGYAGVIQDEMASNVPNGILLTQLCSMNNIMFGDNGNLYFYISKEDLKINNFSKVKAYIQSY